MKMLKNSWIGYVISVFLRTSKFLLCIKVLFSVLVALIPVMQMIALASFVDKAIQMQKHVFSIQTVIIPLTAILALLIFNNFSEKINNLIDVRLTNCLRAGYTLELLDKRAKLEYKL